MACENPNVFRDTYDAVSHIEAMNRRYFKMNLSYVYYPPCDNQNFYGKYRPRGKQLKLDFKCGDIVMNCGQLKYSNREWIFQTAKHELAHAICDLKLNIPGNHCERWIRVAKLLGVNHTDRYKTKIHKNSFCNCIIHSSQNIK